MVSRAARAPHNEASVIPEFVVGNGYPEAAQASRRAGKQICKGRKPCSESSAQREPFWLALPVAWNFAEGVPTAEASGG